LFSTEIVEFIFLHENFDNSYFINFLFKTEQEGVILHQETFYFSKN